jgi:alpha-amylase/alpha-mannosidase (GH57 family)
MSRYICIHGHFYQPPRENPWLEAIEIQDSARPYHDWNERITAECYAPNSVSRILDGDGWITKLANNYGRMSFNFGPTVLTWLACNAPDLYESIRQADRESQKLFSGHGSAIAQAYNHMILPLANGRDRLTQVIWGMRDFEHHFGRPSEGMWLPETAVDIETLDVMAACGIRFTILSQHQAARVRPSGGEWQDVSGGRIDPTEAYRCALPSGRSIALFFYDGAVAHDVAFSTLLSAGESLAQRLLGCLSGNTSRPQIVHIATDGETYGHHHHRGDMALAYALHAIESRDDVSLTNYGEFLEKHPPVSEVEIHERTSWSCAHGVDRWYRDCGCNSGGRPRWNQQWREPLRNALDWLRDTLADAYEREARALLKDPWAARDDYIAVILDRSPGNVEAFLSRHARRRLSSENRVRTLKLLEMQRHCLLMYTSCGWFFDELSGMETVQVLQYSGRALQLAAESTGEDHEAALLDRLDGAKSNIPEHRDGRRVFERFVKTAALDLIRVCAHYAVSSLFEPYSEATPVFCYRVDREDYRTEISGAVKLAVGRAWATSEITQERLRLTFAALHFGEHTLSCGVRGFLGEGPYKTLLRDVFEAYQRNDFPETLRMMDKHFGASTYSLKSLFRDEQRKIINLILDETLRDAEAVYRQFYKPYGPLMRFLKDAGIPAPRVLVTSAAFVVNAALNRLLQGDEIDPMQIRAYLDQAAVEEIPLDTDTLEFTFRQSLERMAQRLHLEPLVPEHLRRLEAALGLLAVMPFEVNLWRVQNICYALTQSADSPARRGEGETDELVQERDLRVRNLCGLLRIRLPA